MQASLAGKAGAALPPGHSAAVAASNGNSSGGAHAAANGSSAGAVSSGGASATTGGGLAAYDKLLQENLKPFMQQATDLGGEVCDSQHAGSPTAAVPCLLCSGPDPVS